MFGSGVRDTGRAVQCSAVSSLCMTVNDSD